MSIPAWPSFITAARNGQLEYDFVVERGTDPAVIGLGFPGTEGLEVDAQGDLLLETAAGALRFLRPRIYQDLEDGRHEDRQKSRA